MDSEEIRRQMKYVERIHRPNYIYVDHAGQLKTTGHQLNADSKTLLVDNEYDELGRLKRNKRNSQAALVTDYTYNLRSWMKSVTGALFNQTLYYQDSYAGNTPSYSGNISAMNWTAHGDKRRGYTFDYDNLSRLKKADYLEADLANTNYSTGYVYDKHGNITSLTRRGRTGVSAFGVADALALNPTLSGSADFKDGAGQNVKYTYDQNGSMKTDLNKGISEISYNSLKLPSKLVIANSSGSATNTYLYAADGKKLNVTMQWGSSNSKSTDYAGSKIYENGSLKRILVDGGYIENGIYHYYLQDHLGNNRVVAKTDGAVVQTNHFYPFGMAFAEGIQNSNQPFKYNGKELDAERGLNLYDYMARLMDPVLGRFTTIDPQSEKFYAYSSYVYCQNDPVKHIDPDGKIPWIAGIIGGGIDYMSQVALNKMEGKSWSESLTDVDMKSVAVSAASSMTGVGLVGVVNKAVKLTKVAQTSVKAAAAAAMKAAGEVVGDAAISATSQLLKDGEVDGRAVVADAIMGKVGGKVGDIIKSSKQNSSAAKPLHRQADRAKRLAKGSNPRPSRAKNAEVATQKAERYGNNAAEAASTTISEAGSAGTKKDIRR